MKTVTYTGRYDGSVVSLDEPAEIPPNTRVLVTVLPAHEASGEMQEWQRLSLAGLAEAYSPDEPEYSLSQLKKRNPDYAGG
jgi:hypothetical protein